MVTYTTKKPLVNRRTLINQYPADKFNWWAFLFTWLYFAYHGMWKWAIITFLVGIVFGWTFIIPIAVAIWSGINHNRLYLEEHSIYVKSK